MLAAARIGAFVPLERLLGITGSSTTSADKYWLPDDPSPEIDGYVVLTTALVVISL